LSAAHPSRRVIAVHGKIDLTHADLDALVDAVAARLRDAGVRPGQTVALCFPNTVEVNHQSSI
jgi:acyl-CoA synthetase (AMP-forming)/AMP-acid ligase II